MYLKKCLALLVSAALAVSLLAACGSRALSNVMADLLTGLYDNVSVEVDNDLTAALKKAVSAGGTQEEILAALVNNLNLSGVSISFDRLGSGQQGEHGVTLTFQTGTDPDAAARTALAQWASVFGSLPDNGSYSASVAMIEADNGYYIAVDVEVTRAGSSGKDEPELDYTTSTVNGVTTYTVYTAVGLRAWNTAVQKDMTLNCTLEADITLTGEWTPIGTSSSNAYTGIFDGSGHSITGLTVSSGSCVGLIGHLGSGGKVQNLTLENVNITGTSSGDVYVGGVVGYNYGTVTGCTVSGSVSGFDSSDAGAVAGANSGTIADCHVTGSGTITGNIAGGVVGYAYGGTVTGCSATTYVTGIGSAPYAGGVVGFNSSGTVTACYSTGDVTATSGSAGGVVGLNYGTVTACYHTIGIVTGGYAGGVVGYNESGGGTVTGCYSTGDVTATSDQAGGVVGWNESTVTACYWSGTVNGTAQSDQGIGSGTTGGTTQVDGRTVKWTKSVGETLSAMDAMNDALVSEDSPWRYEPSTSGNPPLTLKKTG